MMPKPRKDPIRTVLRPLIVGREIEEWAESRPVSDLPPPPNTGGLRLTPPEVRPAGDAGAVTLAGQVAALCTAQEAS